MTLITFQDGKPVMRDGKIGTEQDCCCSGGGGAPCDHLLCCEVSVLPNALFYLLDPFGGSGLECDENGNPVRGYTLVNMTDGQCPGGGQCTFEAIYYWTATFTNRTVGDQAPCIEVADPAFDDVVFVTINCPCEDLLTDVTLSVLQGC